MLSQSSALLVVDLQTLTLPNSITLPVEQLLANVERLIAAFRSAGLPVIHAVSTGMPAGRTGYGSGPRTWPDDQLEIAERARPVGDELVVRRAAWSAFAGTALADRLATSGSDTVVIVGLATPFGIESTARAAYDLGFNVVVPADGVAGPDASAHEWTLTRVIPLLGQTTTVRELLA